MSKNYRTKAFKKAVKHTVKGLTVSPDVHPERILDSIIIPASKRRTEAFDHYEFSAVRTVELLTALLSIAKAEYAGGSTPAQVIEKAWERDPRNPILAHIAGEVMDSFQLYDGKAHSENKNCLLGAFDFFLSLTEWRAEEDRDADQEMYDLCLVLIGACMAQDMTPAIAVAREALVHYYDYGTTEARNAAGIDVYVDESVEFFGYDEECDCDCLPQG